MRQTVLLIKLLLPVLRDVFCWKANQPEFNMPRSIVLYESDTRHWGQAAKFRMPGTSSNIIIGRQWAHSGTIDHGGAKSAEGFWTIGWSLKCWLKVRLPLVSMQFDRWKSCLSTLIILIVLIDSSWLFDSLSVDLDFCFLLQGLVKPSRLLNCGFG